MTASLHEPATTGIPDTAAEPHDVAQENARAAAIVAASLAGEEPTHVVLSPGSRSAPLALAFDALPSARVHVVLDERAAGFVALGIGRATGRPAVLVCTSGSAGAHYLPAVIEAREARVPLIALTADRPPELQHCGAPQTVAQTRLFGEHVRFQLELPVPDRAVAERWLSNAMAQARARALGSPPGPVHVNAPFREPLWDAHVTASSAPQPALVRQAGRRFTDAEVETLARELCAHRRGVIACGPLAPATVDATELARALCALGRALGWPVLADAASGVRFGAPDAGVVVGAAEAIVRHAPSAALVAPSMVLRIGMHPTSKPVAGWLARQPNTVLIDPDGDWHDPHGAAEALWIADAAPLCAALARAVEAQPRSSDPRWLAHWQELERRAATALASASCEGGWEGAVARAVVHALPSGAQLHVGSSMPIRDLDAFAPLSERRIAIHCNRGCNGIDGAVSTALGEALARPDPPTVALIGDLTLLHDLDGLAAAAAQRARLTIVVVHNDGGGIFRFLPIARHPTAFERLFVTPQPADIGALCGALAIDHRCIDLRIDGAEPRGIAGALERALAADGPSLVEVRVDPETNAARHAQAWARAARALERGERRTL